MEKKKILIVNFTRMGDLLQSTPLFAGLKRKYPEAEITLAVMSDFRGICSGFPGIDRIVAVDFVRIISRLSGTQYSLEDNFSYLAKIVRRAGTGYDMVINLSHTPLSAAYCHLTGCEDIRGQTLIPDGAFIIRHPWMNYFFNVYGNRLFNSFNLVDMYNMTGDIEMRERKEYYSLPEEAKSFPSQFLKGYDGKFIGFQLGASTDDKRWEPKMFGELANLIRRKLGWNIIIFGSGEESELLEEMREVYPGPLIDAIDKTSVPQLAALLRKCELLVTNDTGTMHLATAVGTGVVVLDLGEALAADTGPYTEKAVVLEANIPCAPCSFENRCLDHKCHRCIKPEDVFKAVMNFEELTGGEIRQLEETPQLRSLIISRPVFEADGFWNLIPLIKRPLTVDELLKWLYRRMWKKSLNPERETHHTDFEQYYDTPEDPAFREKLAQLREPLTTLSKLSEKGIETARKLGSLRNSPQIDALKLITGQFIVIDNSLYQLELTVPELAPISTVFRLNKNNMERSDLGYIADKAEELYRTVQRQTEMMNHWLSEYIEKYRPESEAVLA